MSTALHWCGPYSGKEAIRSESCLHLCGWAAKTVCTSKIPYHDRGKTLIDMLSNNSLPSYWFICFSPPFLPSINSHSPRVASALQATGPPLPLHPRFQTLPSPPPLHLPLGPPWEASFQLRRGVGCWEQSLNLWLSSFLQGPRTVSGEALPPCKGSWGL